MIIAACGGDDDDTPTTRPTETPAVQPSPEGDDDESLIRHTVLSFVYFINENEFDNMCDLYAQSVLDDIPCSDIQQNITGVVELSQGERMRARTPGIDSVEVNGDAGAATYTLCLDSGSGENCQNYTIRLVREDDEWKISG